MRAFVYCRISLDRNGEGLGVQRQEQDCRELAADLGWEVLETYVDNDVSASGSKPRPQYRQMLARLEAGRADAIIAWHPDRLYRRIHDLEELIEVCERHKVAIRTVKAGEMDVSTPTGRMVARILGSVARQEVEHKADRWVRSRQQSRANGRPPSSRARLFGYSRDGLSVVEEEAAVTRWMAQQVTEGASINGLCRQLKRKEVSTTLGNDWRPNTLRNYLRNPRLAGMTQWKGEIVGEGTFPAILDRETWERTKALLDRQVRRTNVRVALLNGLVHCGLCGERMHTGQRTEDVRIYRCSPVTAPYLGCGKVSVIAHYVEDAAEAYAKEMLANPVARDALRERTASGDVASLVASLDADTRRLRELEDSLSEGRSAVGAITRAMDQVQARMGATREQIARVAPAHVDLDAALTTWPTDLDRRRALVDLFVERVTIGPSRLGNRFDYDRITIARKVIG